MTGPADHRVLRPFWFPLSRGLGIGVTAESEDEARAMAEAARYLYFPDATFTGLVPDVDISQLDQDYVVPNAGPIVVRGVWFPHLKV